MFILLWQSVDCTMTLFLIWAPFFIFYFILLTLLFIVLWYLFFMLQHFCSLYSDTFIHCSPTLFHWTLTFSFAVLQHICLLNWHFCFLYSWHFCMLDCDTSVCSVQHFCLFCPNISVCCTMTLLLALSQHFCLLYMTLLLALSQHFCLLYYDTSVCCMTLLFANSGNLQYDSFILFVVCPFILYSLVFCYVLRYFCPGFCTLILVFHILILLLFIVYWYSSSHFSIWLVFFLIYRITIWILYTDCNILWRLYLFTLLLYLYPVLYIEMFCIPAFRYIFLSYNLSCIHSF